MEKLYERINFENSPSVKTPLNEENLNKMDSAINALDDRVVDLNSDIASIATLSPNVYNPVHEQPNAILGGDGAETVNSKYKTNIEYIPVEYGNYVSFYGNSTTDLDGVQNYCLYDENKAFIGRFSFENVGIVTKKVDHVNAKYIRFSVGINATDVMVVIDETEPSYTDLLYIPYGKKIKYDALPDIVLEELQAIEDLDYGYKYIDLTSQLEKFGSAYISSSGVSTNSSSWETKRMLISELPSFRQISVVSSTTVIGRCQIAFYSADTPTDETFISGLMFASKEQCETIITEIPDNAVSLLVTNLLSGGNIAMVAQTEKQTIVTELKENVASIDALQLREQRAKFDNQFNYIAYSAIWGIGKGPNSEEHYLWAAQRKFTAIKGDVRISSDNEIIMCHDEGFTLNGNGEITNYDATNSTPIRQMTAAQCYDLVYEGTTDHVCGIDSLIRTCKLYGKIAFVTVRSSDLDDIFPKLFASLDKYNMRERTIINGFSYETMKRARKYDKNIMLSWVQTHNHQITNADVDMADALGNCLISCYDYSGADETKAGNQSDAVIAYAKQKDIRVYEAIIGYDSDLNNEVLFDRGFSGAQIAFEPAMFGLLP